MTLMEYLLGGSQPGPEEPWRRNSLTVSGPGNAYHFCTPRERASLVSGRALWLADIGADPELNDDLECEAYGLEILDCLGAVHAYTLEDRRNGKA